MTEECICPSVGNALDCPKHRREEGYGLLRRNEKLVAENTRQRVELEAANAARISAVANEKQWHDAAERAIAANTLLGEALRRFMDLRPWLLATKSWRFCRACGRYLLFEGKESPHATDCWVPGVEAIVYPESQPAVTGTTSDNRSLRKLPFPDPGPCACGAVQNDWGAVHSHETVDGIKHRKGGCARG